MFMKCNNGILNMEPNFEIDWSKFTETIFSVIPWSTLVVNTPVVFELITIKIIDVNIIYITVNYIINV